MTARHAWTRRERSVPSTTAMAVRTAMTICDPAERCHCFRRIITECNCLITYPSAARPSPTAHSDRRCTARTTVWRTRNIMDTCESMPSALRTWGSD
jgi:hypothetical protein